MQSEISIRSNPERTYVILDADYCMLYSSEPGCTSLPPQIDRMVRILTALDGTNKNNASSSGVEDGILVRVYRLRGAEAEQFAVMLERYRTRITE